MLFKAKTLSWAFPIPITAIAFFLSIIYMAMGLIFTWVSVDQIASGEMLITESLMRFHLDVNRQTLSDPRLWTSTIMILIWMIFWIIEFRNLSRLTNEDGNRTIDAYYARFVVIHMKLV